MDEVQVGPCPVFSVNERLFFVQGLRTPEHVEARRRDGPPDGNLCGEITRVRGR
jgi:hypothetical protein